MLHIHQINVHILYMPGPDLYIVNWLFNHKHTEYEDKELAGMSISIHILSTAIDVLIFISIADTANIYNTSIAVEQG